MLIVRPAFSRETPEFLIIAGMDALSDALRVLGLTGAVFLDAEFTVGIQRSIAMRVRPRWFQPTAG